MKKQEKNKNIVVEKAAFDGLLSALVNARPIKAEKIRTGGDKSKGKPIMPAR